MQTSADSVSRALPSDDPTRRLASAPVALAKYLRLKAQAEDSGAVAQSLAERQYLASQRLMDARASVEARKRQPTPRFYVNEPSYVHGRRNDSAAMEGMHFAPSDNSAAALEMAERELAEATVASAEIAARIAAVNARRDGTAQRIKGWLGGLPAATVLRDAADLPSLAKGSRATPQAIEAVRGDIAKLKLQIEETRSAPIPSAEAKALLRQQIEVLAARGEPDVLRLVELGREIHFPTQQITAPGGVFLLPDMLAIVAWAAKDLLIARLDAEVEAVADDGASLGREERQRRERKARRALLDCERMEEFLISEAEHEGTVTPRRPDASLIAVLGLDALPVAA